MKCMAFDTFTPSPSLKFVIVFFNLLMFAELAMRL